MSSIEEKGKEVGKRVSSFLTGKPLWLWWIVYTVICALIFGVFYLVIFVLTVKWWITLILIVAAGIIWGSVAYDIKKPEKNKDSVS